MPIPYSKRNLKAWDCGYVVIAGREIRIATRSDWPGVGEGDFQIRLRGPRGQRGKHEDGMENWFREQPVWLDILSTRTQIAVWVDRATGWTVEPVRRARAIQRRLRCPSHAGQVPLNQNGRACCPQCGRFLRTHMCFGCGRLYYDIEIDPDKFDEADYGYTIQRQDGFLACSGCTPVLDWMEPPHATP